MFDSWLQGWQGASAATVDDSDIVVLEGLMQCNDHRLCNAVLNCFVAGTFWLCTPQPLVARWTMRSTGGTHVLHLMTWTAFPGSPHTCPGREVLTASLMEGKHGYVDLADTHCGVVDCMQRL